MSSVQPLTHPQVFSVGRHASQVVNAFLDREAVPLVKISVLFVAL